MLKHGFSQREREKQWILHFKKSIDGETTTGNRKFGFRINVNRVRREVITMGLPFK
jgi:hypothetical protein